MLTTQLEVHKHVFVKPDLMIVTDTISFQSFTRLLAGLTPVLILLLAIIYSIVVVVGTSG